MDETQPEVAPALFDLPDGAAMAIRPGPLLLVRLGGDPMDGFAGRREALRAVSGGAVSQGLACGTRAGEEGGVVTKGRIELSVGGDSRILGPGDAYYFKSSIPHRFRNPGRDECEIVSASSPPTF